MSARRKKAAPAPVEPYPMVVETFREPSSLLRERQDEPSSFNGWVRVTRYRITVERIEEPVEVIHERLRKLWRECDNHHEWQPIEAAAKAHGLVLDRGERGTRARGKW